MAREIDYECLKCSEQDWRGKIQPECFKGTACYKKRSWYRKIDQYRENARKHHHYLKYAQGNCCICQSDKDLQAHHIKAQINGGEHTKSNVMTLCVVCHSVVTKYYQAIRGLKQVES